MVARYGGPAPHVVNRGSLEYALNALDASVYGQPLYPSLVEKASAVAFAIISTHVFLDGNKRTATDVLFLVLELNGFTLLANDQEIVNTMTGLASGQIDYKQLVTWVSEHVRAFSGDQT